MSRSATLTGIGLAVLYLCAVGVTISGFFTFILPDDRNTTFYAVLAFLFFAELALFGYTGYLLTGWAGASDRTHAVRLRVAALVVVWFLLVLATGCYAVRPSMADSFLSDGVIFFQLLFTVLLLLAAFFLHRQDIVVDESLPDRGQERDEWLDLARGVEGMLATVRQTGDSHPDRAAEIDCLAKQVDMVRSQLASPAPPERLAQGITLTEIRARVKALGDRLGALRTVESREFDRTLADAKAAAEDALAALSQRKQATSL